MKVLWFTHLPPDAINRRFGRTTKGTGFWIHSLVEPLARSGQVELAIVALTPGDPQSHFRDGDTEYFGISQSRACEILGLFNRSRARRALGASAEIVRDWKPDLIHVHGTERQFGLLRARGTTNVPTVVSIQGIAEEVLNEALGVLSLREAIVNTTVHDVIRGDLAARLPHRIRSQVPPEREILNGIDAVIGRTDWDRAHVRAINPKLPYYHVDEMLRPEVWKAEPWSPRKTSGPKIIMSTSGWVPWKGVPVLLRAVAILRRWGYDVRLRIMGFSADAAARRGLGRYLLKLIRTLGLEGLVELPGWQSADELVRAMHQSDCFVTPSLIENGCNALSEAQLVGMPCVATYVGGMTTTVRDGETGLFFSRADAAMLARQIERILLDDALAARLGQNARRAAQARHDPDAILRSLLHCYGAVASGRPADPDTTMTRPRFDTGSAPLANAPRQPI